MTNAQRPISMEPTIASTAEQAVAGELIIAIRPGGYAYWCGTAAQLKAEALIPEGFSWPKAGTKTWNDDRFGYFLFRARPSGFKGRLPSDHDYWKVRRALIAPGRDCWAAARVYEKEQDLARELWLQSPAYERHFARYWVACEDKAFQAFKAIFVPPPKKRGRPRKSASIERTQP